MYVLNRKIGQRVLLPDLGLTVEVLALHPRLTLLLTNPVGRFSLSTTNEGADFEVPELKLTIKVMQIKTNVVKLGFATAQRTRIMRGEEVGGRNVVGCC